MRTWTTEAYKRVVGGLWRCLSPLLWVVIFPTDVCPVSFRQPPERNNVLYSLLHSSCLRKLFFSHLYLSSLSPSVWLLQHRKYVTTRRRCYSFAVCLLVDCQYMNKTKQKCFSSFWLAYIYKTSCSPRCSPVNFLHSVHVFFKCAKTRYSLPPKSL